MVSVIPKMLNPKAAANLTSNLFQMELKVSQQAEKLCDTWTRGTERVHTLTYFSLGNCSVHFQCWGKIQTPKWKKKAAVFLYCAFPEELSFFLF